MLSSLIKKTIKFKYVTQIKVHWFRKSIAKCTRRSCEITEKGSTPLSCFFFMWGTVPPMHVTPQFPEKLQISSYFKIWLLEITLKVFSRNEIIGVRTLITFNTFMLYVTQTTESGRSVCTGSMQARMRRTQYH